VIFIYSQLPRTFTRDLNLRWAYLCCDDACVAIEQAGYTLASVEGQCCDVCVPLTVAPSSTTATTTLQTTVTTVITTTIPGENKGTVRPTFTMLKHNCCCDCQYKFI